MEINTLLADPTAIHLELIVPHARGVKLVVKATQSSVLCPLCRLSSKSIHSHYTRAVADLPWHGIAVKLELQSRRFRCRNTLCRRRIFCEHLPLMVAHYARKTVRLNEALTLLSFALGGEAGARLARELGMIVSHDTLLRRIRYTALPEPPTPTVLGVDDWAKRKGRAYGTILVDLQRRRPIDLLPDREAATFAAWLTAHPGVEIISRDRGGAYSEGARRGAPEALQVADRWHLLKNLGDAVERIVNHHYAAMRKAFTAIHNEERLRVSGAVEGALAKLKSPHRHEMQLPSDEAAAAHEPHFTPGRERRLAAYTEVARLHAAKVSQRKIARVVGLSRNTVRRYLRAGEFPERKPKALQRTQLDRFAPYLTTRWQEGCWSATQLWGEVQAQGFPGSVDSVQRFVARLCSLLPTDMRETLAQRTSGVKARHPLRLVFKSAREVMWLLLRAPEKLKVEERQLLDHIFRASSEIVTTHAFAQKFQKIVRARDHLGLTSWLWRARRCQVRDLTGFAAGLQRDLGAVKAALMFEWSNGQVEGQVNKLKTIKRQMYGRANFDLLRARVLHAV